MANDKPRGSTVRSARLPAILLVVLLAAISGSVLWLTLATPPEQKAAPPAAKSDVAARKAPKAVTSPDEAPPPSKPATLPETDTKTATQPDSATPNQAETPHKDAAPPRDPPASDPVLAKPTTAAASKIDGPAPKERPQAADPTRSATPETDTPEAGKTPPAAVTQDDATAARPLTPVIPKLPRPPPSAPLSQAPDPALIEESPSGLLPIIGRDGRVPWRVYARPFDQTDGRPKVAVVLYGLGSSAAATRTAIQGLPGAISLAFSPYADGLRDWIADARAAGHEAFLMVPMEPVNFPNHDPGPQALLTSLTAKQNTSRLEWILGRAVGYVGVTNFMGSRFTNSTPHMRSFFRNLKLRGLMYLESQSSARIVSGELATANRVPFVPNALYIDSQASRSAIDAQLLEAERLAKKLGQIAVMGFLYPVTLERVATWAKTVTKRGLVLAPVSALAKQR